MACTLTLRLCAAAQNNPNMRIVVAGTENIIMNLYNGQQRSMLITNCIFRLGGVAFMLSNHPADRRMRKYKLKHIVRTHLGASDAAYKCAPTLLFRDLPVQMKLRCIWRA